MNKTAIKNYAISARVQLIEAVKQRAFEYEITEDRENKPDLDTINGRVLTDTEKEQRRQLLSEISRKGYDQVMEEAAYTWFNRFIALRFMEVNGYLPSKVRVFTDENNAFKPEILKQAMTVELDGLDREKVLDLLDKQNNEELYKYLLITQCNALNAALPAMFETIGSRTELLFPANLLKADSVLDRMIREIPEDNWTDQVEIIGWLYQFYITELNEQVYDGSMSKGKIPKELVPAATTIYTPDWAIRYMVENSLGRIAIHNLKYGDWLDAEKKKIDVFKSKWKYYLEEAEQSQEIVDRFRMEESNKYNGDDPPYVNSTFLDPCMGSGHIIVYAFDVFMDIYKSQGYSERDAAQEIVKKNLYGLELDDRAAQLAYFAVMMKARSYDRRFLTRGIKPNLCSIQESNHLNADYLALFGELQPTAQKLVDEFIDAKEYGSILNLRITADEIEQLERKFAEIGETDYDNFFDSARQAGLRTAFAPLLKQAKIMVKKYDVVCTNPPYLGNGRFSPKLDKYIKTYYQDVKSDLSMVMYKKAMDGFAATNGYIAFITTSSWMFLSSFEKLRVLVNQKTITSLVDFGTELFEGKVGHNPIVAWVTLNRYYDYCLTAIRLVDFCYSRRDEKLTEFYNSQNRYIAKQSNFSKIPGSPIAYWVSESFIKVFNNKLIGEIADSKQGVATADNNRFLRLWFECDRNSLFLNCSSHEESLLSDKKWYPYNKGGEFRKWYGNNDYVVNWYSDGMELKAFKKSVLRNPNYYFQECFSWSLVTSSVAAFRYKPMGHIFDVAGMSCFSKNNLFYLLGLCNTNVVMEILKMIAPTINFQCGDIASIPVIINDSQKTNVENKVKENIRLSQTDWDSFETSWDFKSHPLV